MAFLKTLGFIALAATASALPQGYWPTATTSAVSTTTPSASASGSASASASPTSSTGSGINIVNNMDQDIYIWSTSDSTSGMQTLSSGGGTYTESWRTNSDGGGISIKMATSESEDSVLQFEYTKGDDTLWWDLSSINLASDSLFISSGFAVTTDDSSCSSATCSAGDTDCADSYQQSDDVDTFSCSTSAAFTLNLG
ncbi:Secreted thaumatin-like protein calA [Penicillium cosmopolitanum]|uniref:Secreted thaumatin-like protein calA n=1 Tax=Penicillium cosmopolitanum TaxID=1131564 RepID=A0A9X0B4J4_9EURO|nr:Secreted thaumatin-like protein calA [Penicillium cosmopolitanum]KAJ5387888.1 Secreted thaumatin-like protein calA [Penicillium cosmopolitanum]